MSVDLVGFAAVQDVQRFFVHGLAQGFARFEMGHTLLWNLHALAGSGIAANAGRTAVDGEAAKPTDFNNWYNLEV